VVGRLAAAILAVLFLAGAPSASAGSCPGGYAYAGLQSADPAAGAAATLSALSLPQVRNGHVAAWVGVGGHGLGPRGADEWIQVGLSAFPGSATRVYYEVKRPGARPRYVELGRPVGEREPHRVAVREEEAAPGWWRVWVDGRPVSRRVFLPGSHGSFRPIVTAESWNEGRSACNRFRYRFADVSVVLSPGGLWRELGRRYVLEARGYRLLSRGRAAFVAVARR
jgi:hypothetical protein